MVQHDVRLTSGWRTRLPQDPEVAQQFYAHMYLYAHTQSRLTSNSFAQLALFWFNFVHLQYKKSVMERKWAYSRRNNIRRRAVKIVNKVFDSLEKEIHSQTDRRVEENCSVQSTWHQEPTSPQRKSPACCDPFIKSLLHEVLRNQEILMEQQRSIMMMFQDLQANNDSEIADEDNISQRHFPIEDLKALTELENELQSCPETRRKMVHEFGLLGGVDVKDTVWRIMKQAIKNDFAKTVNWRGVNGKTPFQNLEFKNVVIEAVRRNPSCAQTTELEVENVIKRWFHLAGDREGGRKKRSQLHSIKVENSF